MPCFEIWSFVLIQICSEIAPNTHGWPMYIIKIPMVFEEDHIAPSDFEEKLTVTYLGFAPMGEVTICTFSLKFLTMTLSLLRSSGVASHWDEIIRVSAPCNHVFIHTRAFFSLLGSFSRVPNFLLLKLYLPRGHSSSYLCHHCIVLYFPSPRAIVSELF